MTSNQIETNFEQTEQELINNIEEAKKELKKLADKGKIEIPTLLIKSHTFSEKTGGNIYLKCETFQRTGSFKVRGAYYKLLKLINKYPNCEEVTAASAGNHAQGVALSASILGLKATIFVPRNAPAFKLRAIRDYGASIVEEATLDDAIKKAEDRAESVLGNKDFFIHPYNDYDIIAGQGTIGQEIFDQLAEELEKEKQIEEVEELKNLEFTVAVPIGGGGLISGIAFALKEVCGCKKVKIVGVQSDAAPNMKRAFEKFEEKKKKELGLSKLSDLSKEEKDKVLKLSDVELRYTIADGIKVQEAGEKTFEICKKYLDDIVLVDDWQIASAIYTLLVREKIIAEAAGAVSLAAILSGEFEDKYVKGENVVIVISGGNIDLSLLAWIALQQHSREWNIFRLESELPDKPGAFAKVSSIIAENQGNIIQVREDRMRSDLRPGRIFISIYVEALGKNKPKDTMEKILAALGRKGYDFKVIKIFR